MKQEEDNVSLRFLIHDDYLRRKYLQRNHEETKNNVLSSKCDRPLIRLS